MHNAVRTLTTNHVKIIINNHFNIGITVKTGSHIVCFFITVFLLDQKLYSANKYVLNKLAFWSVMSINCFIAFIVSPPRVKRRIFFKLSAYQTD